MDTQRVLLLIFLLSTVVASSYSTDDDDDDEEVPDFLKLDTPQMREAMAELSSMFDDDGNINEDKWKSIQDLYQSVKSLSPDSVENGPLKDFASEMESLKSIKFPKGWRNIVGMKDNDKGDHDEEMDENLIIDKESLDDLQKIYNKDEANGKWFTDKTKTLLTNPSKVLEEYSKMDAGDLIDSLAKRLGTTVDDMVTSYSVSESLEFMIDHYTRGARIEGELDDLLKKFDLRKEKEEEVRIAKYMTEELQTLIKRTTKLIESGEREQITAKDYKQELVGILGIKKTKIDNYLDDLDNKNNLTTIETLQQFENERQEMHEEARKLSEMKNIFIKHSMRFQAETGAAGDFKIESFLEMAKKHKKGEINLKIFHSLLKKYQTLEGLKNNILIEKDQSKKEKMEKETQILEEEIIPEFLEDNRSEFSKLLPDTTGIIMRSLKKMMNLDLLMRNVKKLQDDQIQELSSQTVLLGKLNEILEEAARIGIEKIQIEHKDKIEL